MSGRTRRCSTRSRAGRCGGRILPLPETAPAVVLPAVTLPGVALPAATLSRPSAWPATGAATTGEHPD